MSDSAKLRFVYGMITYILSLLALSAILVLSLLIGFEVLSPDFSVLIFIFAVGFIFLFFITPAFFSDLYTVGKKDGRNEPR